MTTAADYTASFRAATGRRKGDAFYEAGMWWVIDADGHQWGHDAAEGWVRYTDADDEYAQAVARSKRRKAA